MSEIKKVENAKVEITSVVDGEKWAEAYNKAFNKLAAKTSIDGFRKGKAPKNILKKVINPQSVCYEAVDEIAQSVLEEAIKEHSVELIDRPELNLGTVNETSCTFIFTCPVPPDVELGDYKNLGYHVEEVSVTDGDVEAELDKLKEQKAELEIKEEGELENGDISVIDYEGFKDGVPFEGGKGENFELTIGSGQFIPGFEEQLIGMKTEEEKEINVTFPENYHVEELKGQPVIFKVKLHEIKKKVLPELDEELIKDLKIENVNTLDELKEYYRANLLKSRKDWAENKALDEAINKLVEEATVEIPEVMINSMCDNMINEYGQQFMAQGLSMEQFRSMFGENVDGLRNAFRPEAEKRVKTNLCLNKLAELENLNVGAEDLEKYYSDLAETYSMPVEDVKKYIPESNAKEDLKVRKALDFIRQ
ncbi:MAG: trigger factor [Erysipelotrichaceae bacterium]|nr:trigger factor [Solobacterium sp.]MDD6834872.1 trigger factor [Solobacterium sp.]MDY2731622.1 trigger factor [Erysipelotrichaceae bacterium]